MPVTQRDLEVALVRLDQLATPVDTPGTGSVHTHNTAAARQSYESLDAAIVVVSADPPISAAERDLLVEVDRLAVQTFIVLNKADQLDEAELAEAVAFTRTACARALGRAVHVYPCSARRGGDDAGHLAFEKTYRDYIAERASSDLDAALTGHFARLATAMLDTVMLTEWGLHLAADASTDRVQLFADRVSAVGEQRRGLADRAWAAKRRVEGTVAQSAAQHSAELAADVERATPALLDRELATGEIRQAEATARAAVVTRITDGIEHWRTELISTLENELDTIRETGVRELTGQLADLRAAASELLGLDLSVPAVDSALRPSQRFWYSFDPGVGWQLPLTDTLSRAAPGRRRRARRRVLDEIPGLVDRQFGRVRADLAQRFARSVEELIKQLGAQHDEALGRIRLALDEVSRLNTTATTERDERADDLRERRAALTQLLADLRP
jgi:hypothetical protein